MPHETPLVVTVAEFGSVFFAGWMCALLFHAFTAWAWEKFSELLDRAAIEID